jgi:hypothetical protein
VIRICHTHQIVCRFIRLNGASLASSELEEEAFMPTLFDAYTLGDRLTLKNCIVMAPNETYF